MQSDRLVCAGCGGEVFVPFFEGPDRLQEKPARYQLWRCQRCNTVALHPPPSPDLTESYYPEDYVAYRPGLASGTLSRWSASYGASKQVRMVLQKKETPGRALDVGCGAGNFLNALQQQGWKAQGLEINPRIARSAHEQFGLDVIVGDSLAGAFTEDIFDLVTFWDVLEHLDDPRRALREARRIARPAALLIVGIPNPESLEARCFGPYWAGWDAPRHLWLFPKQVLCRMLEESGWKVEEVRYARGRHFLLAQSLRFWLQDRRLPRFFTQALLALFQSWLAQALLLPYFLIVERLKVGSAMVLFSRPGNDF